MKGVVLAGGNGTRLYPTTISITKQLLPIYDKPMIYYPISALMLAGIRDILIISTPDDIHHFQKLLGNGKQFGVNFSYEVQQEPKGIAQAIIIAENFISDDSFALILGDNIFYGAGFSGMLNSALNRTETIGGATIFAYPVKDAERFGVVEFDIEQNIISIEEKPQNPKSNYAITGLYFYDNNALEYAKSLKPSTRGELEITDLNKIYLEKKSLKVEFLGRGFAWLDTGTHSSLLRASEFVKSTEENQGIKIACLEEIAYRKGFLSKDEILLGSKYYKDNEYYSYIRELK